MNIREQILNLIKKRIKEYEDLGDDVLISESECIGALKELKYIKIRVQTMIESKSHNG